jgi:tRNA dimethylallyltransferase
MQKKTSCFQPMKKRIIFLVGPTAVGKTETGIFLAKKLNAEIISCDSMQIYKGIDILSSQPTPAQARRVAHHLVGMIPPTQSYNVSRYRKAAVRTIKDMRRRKKLPLFVGGTGLYMNMLLDGIFSNKGEDPDIRARLAQEAHARGSVFLHERLQRVDPEAAARIHCNDIKRIVRALEVFEVTGKPISQLQKERKGLWQQYDIQIFCLTMELASLYARIEARIDKMFRKGAVREVERLRKYRLSKTARYAIGIKEISGYLQKEYPLDEAKRLMKLHTRHYARRQLTWFRKDKRIQWIEITRHERSAAVAGSILKIMKG